MFTMFVLNTEIMVQRTKQLSRKMWLNGIVNIILFQIWWKWDINHETGFFRFSTGVCGFLEVAAAPLGGIMAGITIMESASIDSMLGHPVHLLLNGVCYQAGEIKASQQSFQWEHNQLS